MILVAAISHHLASADKYGGEFLNLPVGAKAMGIGGAFGPLADDASSIYWNPAGLGKVTVPTIMLTHTALYANLANHDFVALAWPMGKKTSIGLGWIRLGVDGIPRFGYTIGTPPEGSFGDNENAFYLSAGTSYDKIIMGKPITLYPGGSVKFIYDRLDDRQATGLGLDLGVILGIDLGNWFAKRSESQPLKGMLPALTGNPKLGQLSFSIVIQDLGGTSIAWNTVTQHNDIRPAAYKFGAAYQQPISLLRSTVTLSAENSSESYQQGRFGGEFRYRNLIALRAGREQEKLTMGAGLAIWRFGLDYAYNSHDLGNTHRIGASYRLR